MVTEARIVTAVVDSETPYSHMLTVWSHLLVISWVAVEAAPPSPFLSASHSLQNDQIFP